MLRSKKDILVALIMSVSLLISACGGKSTADPTISTAVAQTVAAQNSSAENTATITPLPLPTFTTTPPAFSPTVTPAASKIPPTLPAGTSNSKYLDCMKANLTGETIPDGTIMRPGEQFTKIWHIQNNSTCTWDTSYKIVFWDGDVLGGAYVYNFPQSATPGLIMDVPLVLTAPAANGTYKSSWMFQTPDGINFGVGQYSQPFYTQIVVSDAKKPNYGIESIEYEIVRDPATGCPANVFYTVYAKITTTGPLEVTYYWAQSDGNDSNPKTLIFNAAGSQTLSREWSFHLGSSTTHDKWMKIIVVEPVFEDNDKAIFRYECQ